MKLSMPVRLLLLALTLAMLWMWVDAVLTAGADLPPCPVVCDA